MSGSKVWEYLCCIEQFEIQLTTLGSFLRTVRREVRSWLVPDEMTCVCGEGVVHI